MDKQLLGLVTLCQEVEVPDSVEDQEWSDGYLTASFDGAWQKRGTDRAYNSLTVAFNRTAKLSSDYDSWHAASNAVDGINDCIHNKQLAAAGHEVGPWLSIHLEEAYYIHRVVIYARPGYYAHQADNILVIVNDGNVNQTCGTEYPGPTTSGDVILFMCPIGTRGSYVFIQKTPKTISEFTLCEVEVYG